jgi:hypothetical protein
MLVTTALLLTLALPGPALAAGQGPDSEEPARELRKAWIAIATDAGPLEDLAAREIRRYVYLRTGRLLPIVRTPRAPASGRGFVISRADRSLVETRTPTELVESARELDPQGYRLATVIEPTERPTREVLYVLGGDDIGALYGAYRALEHFGIRFYLHGDVIPDHRIELVMPEVDETAEPLFALRGIQPFHDFPEGPDWWNADEYQLVVAQLPKLGMNFLGLHTYSEGRPYAEPTVWVGTPEDLDASGRVAASYPASYNSTALGGVVAYNWGYRARPTSAFHFGASQLFPEDEFGAEAQAGALPLPTTPEAASRVFDETGGLLRRAFTLARALGIKTCVGTETPLVVPQAVAERLRARGRDPQDSEVLEDLYRGIFSRAARIYAPDYYWLWTPEKWTWESETEGDVEAALSDLEAALSALRASGNPMRLATCGWVLGPRQDRALFDRALPKDIALSALNRKVGRASLDPAFGRIADRSKWAIPWLEDDPSLTAPQLWVARVRRDAEDALRLGCDGLIGLHWRTRNVAPQLLMLARAGWRQDWERTSPTALGAIGGHASEVAERTAIQGGEPAEVYRDVRVGLSAYRLALPAGSYSVRLQFVEPQHVQAGRRVFDVVVQGQTVIEGLDLVERTGGPNRALDATLDPVEIGATPLEIRFVPRVGRPVIAALVVSGGGVERKINCGGPARGGYVADDPTPTEDFYRDWAEAEFGREIASAAAKIFARIDSRLPTPAEWTDGPGGLRPDRRPWSEVESDYGFVKELAGLGRRVRGTLARERFGYWLGQFEYMRAMARLRCVWGEYEGVMGEVEAGPGAEQPALARARALPAREALGEAVAEVYGHLLATLGTPGERGTLANWELHILPALPLEDPRLASLLEPDAVPSLALPTAYDGPTRVILPAPRGNARSGDPLRLEVLILSRKPPQAATLYHRRLGIGAFRAVPIRHVARGVYEATFPRAVGRYDLEYYLEVEDSAGKTLREPPSAPEISRTIVVMRGPGGPTPRMRRRR